jgi:hypothetical protein
MFITETDGNYLKHPRGLNYLGTGGHYRYWLPSLLKHEYVALRFVAQAAYEKAAQMHIFPLPDVVTRVFILFRGVLPDDVGLWTPVAVRATAEDGATFWTKVVGVDAVRAFDPTLFRVVGWKLIECKSAHSARTRYRFGGRDDVLWY